ncbi:hypothetical protein [uncultured Flavobacterium sp.]|uniref:hypothetical protein n=1 Tax=uncultured Flavobacterium sp. TaxID=165435 RepID=UPI0025E938DA|nr:hypothetical protein [uncultured Flavobacterium sp.]
MKKDGLEPEEKKVDDSIKNQIIKEELKKRNLGNCEIVVLEGRAEPVYREKSLEVSEASIAAVHEFLVKKGVQNEDIVNSKVEFSYSKLFLNLYYSVRRRNPDTIKGSLKLHPDLLKFGINSNDTYSTIQLSDFIKMNRHYFENKDVAMKLVSDLRNFEGKVMKDVELKADTRANSRVLISQEVESNIPNGFILLLPVFLGQNPVRLEVEINITSDFTCSLISPDLKALIDLETKKIVDGELDKIKKLHPDLKIFEL